MAGLASSSGSVLSLSYCPYVHTTDEGATGLLSEAPKLLVGTPRGVAVVDTQTYDIVSGHYFGPEAAHVVMDTSSAQRERHPLASKYRPLPEVDTSGGFAFAHSDESGSTCCCSYGIFSPTISLLSMIVRPMEAVQHTPSAQTAAELTRRWQPTLPAQAEAPGEAQAPPLSVFQGSSLPPDSPLASCSSSQPTSGQGPAAASARHQSAKR